VSSLRAPWQNGPYKTQHTEQHKTRKTPRRNKHLEKAIFCVLKFKLPVCVLLRLWKLYLMFLLYKMNKYWHNWIIYCTGACLTVSLRGFRTKAIKQHVLIYGKKGALMIFCVITSGSKTLIFFIFFFARYARD